jgi:dCMP deaminase
MSTSSGAFTETTRPDWDATWLAAAKVTSLRSLCSGAQVGCVIVSADNRILASGYNGPPAGFEHSNRVCSTGWCPRADLQPSDRSADYEDCPSLHAEANAISVSDYHTRCGGTIYVTSHVCWGCAKLIANSGIKRVVVLTDRVDMHRNPERSYQFLGELGVALSVRDPFNSIFLARGARLARS